MVGCRVKVESYGTSGVNTFILLSNITTYGDFSVVGRDLQVLHFMQF